LLDFQPVQQYGESMWLLRDPWQLGERQLLFPAALAQMLPLCDGTRGPRQIQSALSEHLGVPVPFDIISEALAQLDAAYLLQNSRYERRRQELLAVYRAQPYRPPALAGLSYPAAPAELAALLRGYGDGDSAAVDEWQGHGIVSPHIDYPRGGPVYAQVWRRAAPAVLVVECPPGATLFVDAVQVKQTGARRRLVTPPLPGPLRCSAAPRTTRSRCRCRPGRNPPPGRS